jgi:Uma2 family endonuclease
MSSPTMTPSLSGSPRLRRWTKEEYHTMGALGWFEDQQVELLDGEIVQMPVPKNSHCVGTDNAAEVLRVWFPKDRYWVRMQMPLDLGLDTEPQPDVAVVSGPKTSYSDHPQTALLTVEVSDTTLSMDRQRKACLYARAGIQEYWIVNLVDQQLEIHRTPIADASTPYGARYQDLIIRARGEDALPPLAQPQAAIAVVELLP